MWLMESHIVAMWVRQMMAMNACTGTLTSSWREELIPSTPSRTKTDLALTTSAGREKIYKCIQTEEGIYSHSFYDTGTQTETGCPGVSSEEAADCFGTTVMCQSVLNRQVSLKASDNFLITSMVNKNSCYLLSSSCECVFRCGANWNCPSRNRSHCPQAPTYKTWTYDSPQANDYQNPDDWEAQPGSTTFSYTHWCSSHHRRSTATVLHLWEASAKKEHYPNLWGSEGPSWVYTLAGVLASETEELQQGIQTHLWRSSHRELLGTDSWTLHVSTIIMTTDLKTPHKILADCGIAFTCRLNLCVWTVNKTRTCRWLWGVCHWIWRNPQSKPYQLKRLFGMRTTERLLKLFTTT